MTTQLPPDYETRHTLALALCEHLGLDPEQIETGSLRIELDTDNRHIVRWTGRARINLDNLAGLILKAHHPDDPDCDHPLRRYDGRCVVCGQPRPT